MPCYATLAMLLLGELVLAVALVLGGSLAQTTRPIKTDRTLCRPFAQWHLLDPRDVLAASPGLAQEDAQDRPSSEQRQL